MPMHDVALSTQYNNKMCESTTEKWEKACLSVEDVNDYHLNWYWNKISQWPGIDIDINGDTQSIIEKQGLKPCSPQYGHGYIITLWLTTTIRRYMAATFARHIFQHWTDGQICWTQRFVFPFVTLSLALFHNSKYEMHAYSFVDLFSDFVRHTHEAFTTKRSKILCIWKRRDNRELIAIKFIISKRPRDGCVSARSRIFLRKGKKKHNNSQIIGEGLDTLSIVLGF